MPERTGPSFRRFPTETWRAERLRASFSLTAPVAHSVHNQRSLQAVSSMRQRLSKWSLARYSSAFIESFRVAQSEGPNLCTNLVRASMLTQWTSMHKLRRIPGGFGIDDSVGLAIPLAICPKLHSIDSHVLPLGSEVSARIPPTAGFFRSRPRVVTGFGRCNSLSPYGAVVAQVGDERAADGRYPLVRRNGYFARDQIS